MLQDNLKKYREQAGYRTAKEFAEFLEIPYSSYTGYETKGTWPTQELLFRIAKALHVSIDELLGYDISTIRDCVHIIQDAGGKVEKQDVYNTPLPINTDEYDHISISFSDFSASCEIAKKNIIAAINAAYNDYLQRTNVVLQVEIMKHCDVMLADKPLSFLDMSKSDNKK